MYFSVAQKRISIFSADHPNLANLPDPNTKIALVDQLFWNPWVDIARSSFTLCKQPLPITHWGICNAKWKSHRNHMWPTVWYSPARTITQISMFLKWSLVWTNSGESNSCLAKDKSIFRIWTSVAERKESKIMVSHCCVFIRSSLLSLS